MVARDALQGSLRVQSSTASRGHHHHDDVDSEDELVVVLHDDWVSMVDDGYFWNRRLNTTHWSMPPGMLHRWVRLRWGTYLDVELQQEVGFLPRLDSS